jgi:hypothetical protein
VNDRKEDKIKSECFRAALELQSTLLKNRCAKSLDVKQTICDVYELAIKFYMDGRDRYWKTYTEKLEEKNEN